MIISIALIPKRTKNQNLLDLVLKKNGGGQHNFIQLFIVAGTSELTLQIHRVSCAYTSTVQTKVV